jgi:uncharacterized protein YegP (UPF0339 family)
VYFEVQSAVGGWIWRIRGNNHEIMASSEILARRAECFHAIAIVKRDAATAGVWDRDARQWVVG